VLDGKRVAFELILVGLSNEYPTPPLRGTITVELAAAVMIDGLAANGAEASLSNAGVSGAPGQGADQCAQVLGAQTRTPSVDVQSPIVRQSVMSAHASDGF
jgi:hypothetical protein